MILNKVSKKMTPVKLLVVLIGLTVIISGCAGPRVILHPIEKSDIVQMNKGIPYTPEKDGYFLSKYYLDEVVKAKVEK